MIRYIEYSIEILVQMSHKNEEKFCFLTSELITRKMTH